MEILDIRNEQIITFDKGILKVVANSPKASYFKLKYDDFKGNRILYKFNDRMEIVETYTNGVFNCNIEHKIIQIRDKDAIADSIYYHKETGSTIKYEKTFLFEYGKSYQKELVDKYIASFGNRVVFEGWGYVIDDDFAVDEHGTAYVKGNPSSCLNRINRFDGDGWLHLCLVVGNNNNALDDITVRTDVGMITLGGKSLTTIAKILYIMNPDMNDSVFIQQLPIEVKNRLVKRLEQNAKNSDTEKVSEKT